MNTHAQNATKRVLVLVLAAGAFAFSACGPESTSAQVAAPVDPSDYWYGTPYIRPAEPAEPRADRPRAELPRDDESVQAPRAVGVDPGVPTGPQLRGSV